MDAAGPFALRDCSSKELGALWHFMFLSDFECAASRQIVRKITKQGEIEADMERGSKSNNEIDFDKVPLLS